MSIDLTICTATEEAAQLIQLRGESVLCASRPEAQHGRCARKEGVEGGGGRFHG
jgi:hypothetical protein